MTEVTTRDLVQQCLEGDAVTATLSLQELALAKIAEKIDARRNEIATSMLTPGLTPSASD